MKKYYLLLFSSVLSLGLPVYHVSAADTEFEISKDSEDDFVTSLRQASSLKKALRLLAPRVPKDEEGLLHWIKQDLDNKKYLPILQKLAEREFPVQKLFFRWDVDKHILIYSWLLEIFVSETRHLKESSELLKAIKQYTYAIYDEDELREKMLEEEYRKRSKAFDELSEKIAASFDQFQEQKKTFTAFTNEFLRELPKIHVDHFQQIVNVVYLYLESPKLSPDRDIAKKRALFFLESLILRMDQLKKTSSKKKQWVEELFHQCWQRTVNIFMSQPGMSIREKLLEVLPLLFKFPKEGEKYLKLILTYNEVVPPAQVMGADRSSSSSK